MIDPDRLERIKREAGRVPTPEQPEYIRQAVQWWEDFEHGQREYQAHMSEIQTRRPLVAELAEKLQELQPLWAETEECEVDPVMLDKALDAVGVMLVRQS